ncbi:ribonuclease [Sphingomonas sp. Leaf17]|nr:ribonuclease E/G [Sphingomonas sp. Leaf17]KQM64445.1 ribonuclease [Sphingomonas sp. Leaf17]
MLIDARHREETRVAVVKGNRIEEFDFESAERKQLKGNIYLAKVTRVEPSLQAAFVDYGGNRHGFLAFSEIHPDYYQIPKEDREALLREEAEHAAEEAALRAEHDDDDDADDLDDERFDDEDHDGEHEGETEGAEGDDAPRPRAAKSNGNDDQVEALRQRRMNLRRRYKIQDVIHRRQVLLVQIVKEERGNKGAALTTYLSLAGRYCVLMPNTSHGGGISRKISNAGDRKRLKSIMADMQLPPSMGCIVRTAGLQRTKVEIKRDFDYLARLWDGIRENTLKSAAPALVYGDSDMIKRAIRDIYNKDIDEIIVEGVEGYQQAREYMKLLMPTHARRVKHYSDAVPLFQRSHVEDQLAAMYNPVVQLKSGGYLVINPTEALVSIDINSGRSTREHNIEQTATATNLEAAQEIARQLRLRDMAGLVVIDFIDMDNGSNVRKVEKAMKEALKNDRARIQVGRISSFGLMEMSRQRLRTGVLEASTRQCPHCEGTGLVRTASSAGLSALRLIEDEAARGRGTYLTLRASQEAATYVLNRKRADIAEIEERYGVQVEILPDREEEGARMSVEAAGPPPAHPPRFDPVILEVEDDLEEIEEEFEPEVEEAEEVEERAPRAPRREEEGGDESAEGRKRRRRRRGRRNRREDGQPETQDGVEGDETVDGELVDSEPLDADALDAEIEADGDVVADDRPAAEGGEGRRRRGRRGRRGGRRGEGGADTAQAETSSDDGDAPVAEVDADVSVADAVEPVEAPVADVPKTRRRPRARAKAPEAREPEGREIAEPAMIVDASDVGAPADPVVTDDVPAKPKSSRRKKATPVTDEIVQPEAPAADETVAEEVKPKRTRRKKAEAEVVEAPAKPARAPRAKAKPAAADPVGADPVEAEPAAETPATQAPVVEDTAADDRVGAQDDTDGSPRRGWWQRTFGA